MGKQLADYFGVTHGVLVSSVEEGSPADKAGLKAGDIVTEADGQKVEDSDDLTEESDSDSEDFEAHKRHPHASEEPDSTESDSDDFEAHKRHSA